MPSNPHANRTTKRGAPERVERQQRAYQLSLDGLSLRQVAERMKAEGYKQISYVTVQRLLNSEYERIILPLAAEHVKRQFARLEESRQRLMKIRDQAQEIYAKFHPVVSYGEIMSDEFTGERLEDEGPRLSALTALLNVEDKLLKLEERMAKLFGLDKPTKVDSTVSFAEPASVDDEVAKLAAKLGMTEAPQSTVEPA